MQELVVLLKANSLLIVTLFDTFVVAMMKLCMAFLVAMLVVVWIPEMGRLPFDDRPYRGLDPLGVLLKGFLVVILLIIIILVLLLVPIGVLMVFAQ